MITTSSAVDTKPCTLENKPQNFAMMVACIADEIDDTTDEYCRQIQTAIASAIRFCQRESFYFNESCDVCFKTQPGKGSYDRFDNAPIQTLGRIVAAYCQDANGHSIKLQRQPFDVHKALSNSSARGRPYAYCYFAQKIYLYPTPDQADYCIQLQLAPLQLAASVSMNDFQMWFSEAFDLIKARAKYELYKDILKDSAMAATAFADFNEQLGALKAETSRRIGTSLIQPTRF